MKNFAFLKPVYRLMPSCALKNPMFQQHPPFPVPEKCTTHSGVTSLAMGRPASFIELMNLARKTFARAV
jgi:hypothetical protein